MKAPSPRSPSMLRWLRARDAGLTALRRASSNRDRDAADVRVSVPTCCTTPTLATFAAFGSFALLLLADFGGSMRDRLFAQFALVILGAVLVCLGTLVCRPDLVGRAGNGRGRRSPSCSPESSARCWPLPPPPSCWPSSCRWLSPVRSTRSRIDWPVGCSPARFRSPRSACCGRHRPGTRSAMRRPRRAGGWPVGCAWRWRSRSGEAVPTAELEAATEAAAGAVQALRTPILVHAVPTDRAHHHRTQRGPTRRRGGLARPHAAGSAVVRDV